jgi:hypothetical protein
MRVTVWIVIILCLILVTYLASPLIALKRIAAAVETRDAVSLTERIEFPVLRRSLTKQLVRTYLRLTGKKMPLGAFTTRVAVSFADPVVARLMTVRALLDLLSQGEAGEGAEVSIDRAPLTSRSSANVWPLWLSSEYRGRDFYVYLPSEVARTDQFRMHLRFIRWEWRIVGIELPEDLKEQLARQLIKITQEQFVPAH